MAYEVYFKNIPEDVMEKYNHKNKGTFNRFGGAQEYKLALLIYAMQKSNDNDILRAVKDCAFNIKLYLGGLQLEIDKREEQFAYDRWKEENGELWYCGNNYEDAYDLNEYRTNLINDTVENLAILKYCAESGNYFDEHNHHYEKVREIREILDNFETEMQEIKVAEIEKELKDYRVPDSDYNDIKEELENKD